MLMKYNSTTLLLAFCIILNLQPMEKEELFTSEDELYSAKRRVADLVIEIAEKINSTSSGIEIDFKDRKTNEVNPCYKKTNQGIYLQLCNGNPKFIWSPWGKWNFIEIITSDGDATSTLMNMLQEQVELKKYSEETRSSRGSYGPVYAITSIDGMALPTPSIDKNRCISFGEYRAIKSKLRALKTKYNEEQSAI